MPGSDDRGEAAAAPSVSARGLHRRWQGLGWPRTYHGKLLLGGWLAVALPAVAAAWVARRSGAPPGPALAVGLLIGAVLLALFLRAMLRPLAEAEHALDRRLEGTGVPRSAPGRADAAGRLGHHASRILELMAQRDAALAQASARDPLTGLPSRGETLERLRQTVSLAQRDHLPLSVALLDVDDLAEVRARHGESIADRLMEAVARRLEQLLRGSDWSARWEGDRFLLVLVCDAEGAQAALERVLHDLLSMRVVVDGHDIRATVTLGGAHVRTDDHLTELLSRAAARLAAAHAQGVALRLDD